MIYQSARDWQNAPQKRVLFYGMSGLGKTFLSNLLRDAGGVSEMLGVEQQVERDAPPL